MIQLLEQRRREARAFDDVQRQAEERAAQVHLVSSKPRVVAPAPPAPIADQDLLAELLVSDPRRVATVADLQVLFAHFEQQIENLRESTGLIEIDDLHADRER